MNSSEFDQPLVTVNILAFNRKSDLRRTLERLAEQDYPNLEIIVVDNASADGTSEMVRNEFPSIRLILLDKNIGISGWNEGFKAAKGEYVLVLDDDSYPDFGSISMGVKKINEDDRIGILAYKIFNTRLGLIETSGFKERSRLFVGCGALIRRALLEKIGYYNQAIFIYCHEVEFSARCYDADYYIYYDSTLCVFHAQSATARNEGEADPFQTEFRFLHHLINDAIFRIQKFDTRKVIKYLPKSLLNKLIVAIRFGYLPTFVKGIWTLVIRYPEIWNCRKPLQAHVQQLYDDGNIELFDRKWFPRFAETKLHKIKAQWRDAVRILHNAVSFILFRILRILFPSKPPAGESPRRMLICNLGRIGDNMMGSLFFRNESLISDSEIFYLHDERFSSMYSDYKGNISLVPIDLKRYQRSLIYKIAFIRTMRQLKFSIVINLSVNRRMFMHELTLLMDSQRVFHAAPLPWFSLKWIDNYLSAQYDKIASEGNNYHTNVLSLLSECTKEIPEKNTIFFLSQQTKAWAGDYLRKCSKYDPRKKIISIALVSNDPKKNWDVEKFRRLIKILTREYNIIVIGAGPITGEYEILLREDENFINTFGKLTLTQSAAIISHSDLYIGLDVGITHIAIAMEKPVIALIGGGSQPFWFPYTNLPRQIFLYQPLDCFGCNWNCSRSERECITKVPVDEVVSTIKKICR